MLLPNLKNAVVDIRKLPDYCLNREHSDGKHKARLFLSCLGMTADNAEELRQILLEVIPFFFIRSRYLTPLSLSGRGVGGEGN